MAQRRKSKAKRGDAARDRSQATAGDGGVDRDGGGESAEAVTVAGLPPKFFVPAVLGLFALVSLLLVVKAYPSYRKTTLSEAAQSALEERRFDDALPHIQALLEMEPEQVKWLTRLGDIYLETGQPAEAVEAYERALELKPDQPLGDRLGYALFLAEPESGRGVQMLHDVLREEPDNARANYYAGLVSFQNGELKEAAAFFQRAASDPLYLELSEPHREEIERLLLGDLAISNPS